MEGRQEGFLHSRELTLVITDESSLIGEFVHTEAEATPGPAREPVTNAQMVGHSPRVPQRPRRGADALDAWRPLATVRYTIVDRYERDGQRYVVAREESISSAGFEALTERERQVVSKAVHGSSNKEIAQTLGISEATVRVLMARAANRLGVHGRKLLLEHPALRVLRRHADAS